jgi:putative heme transporter
VSRVGTATAPPPRDERPELVPAEARRLLPAVLVAAAVVLGLYVLAPRIAGLDDTWRRLQDGDPGWLAAALGLEVLSFAGYLVLFRAVVSRYDARISLRDSYAITMAGVVATRLVATAGAGGVALTAWALRRRGMPGRTVAVAVTTFLVVHYAVFMGALVVLGVGLTTGLLAGPSRPWLTLTPALFGAAVIVAALALARVPHDLGRPGPAGRGAARRRLASWAALAPATAGDGVRDALAAVRSRDPRLLGGVAWWAFDVAVLWACFAAFGEVPPPAVLAMGYFVGMLGNLLPLPAGIGGVDGGMIGAFAAFGVPAGLALVAVLTYRVFAFWLPTIPGVLAYGQLRRSPGGTSAPTG